MSGWISIKDKKPIEKSFIACSYDGTIGEAFKAPDGNYYWIKNWCDYDYSYKVEVTHWMPLPKPSKEEDVNG